MQAGIKTFHSPDQIDGRKVSSPEPTDQPDLLRRVDHLGVPLEELEANPEVDGMGNTGAADVSLEGQGLYGSSSAASFMKQVRDAAGASDPTSGMRQTSLRPLLRRSPAEELRRFQNKHSIAKDFVLPSRRAANLMMEAYWVQVHILYPLLEKKSFTREFESLWTGEDISSNESMTFCILNMVFAISCQISQDVLSEQQEASSEVFFSRAIELLQLDILGPGSFQLIQALLLMGQYLQSTDSPQSCWVVIGLAIRTAQGLGLHIPDTTFEFKCQSDREMARRIWHGCVLLDRSVLPAPNPCEV